MEYSFWLLILAFLYLLVSFIGFARKELPARWRKNPAPPLGKEGPAIAYSYTGAMSPLKKESAYLHLPTYTAGLVFHAALFSAILTLFMLLSGIVLPDIAVLILSCVFALGVLSGLGIFIKRIFKPVLRSISNPDDFISNLLVTGFQLMCLLAINISDLRAALYIYSAILLFYLPLGKLKHSFFFFTSRIALGKYYGARGVWKTKSIYR